MFLFGSGTLVAKPFGPLAAGSPTPMQLGTMQEVNMDISASQKELYGKLQFPVAIARTQGKINFKAKFATIYAKVLNDLFFGNTVTTGEVIGQIDEAHAAGTSVTIAPPNSGTFVDDLGVRDQTSGKQMTLVTSSPVAGVSYMVNTGTGVYTFGTGQQGTFISYSYSVATGVSTTATNKPMGSMPTFEVWFSNSQFASSDGSLNAFLVFPNCIAAKTTLPFKNEDFTIAEFDFSAFQDASGNLFKLYLDE
jgi:hypothetical protein